MRGVNLNEADKVLYEAMMMWLSEKERSKEEIAKKAVEIAGEIFKKTISEMSQNLNNEIESFFTLMNKDGMDA